MAAPSVRMQGIGAMLDIDKLSAGYGQARILIDVSLHVGSSEVVALLGRNGAGKSTTLKSIMGLVDNKTGTIMYRGESLLGLAPYRICRAGLGYVPEERRIFADLTVMENLAVGRRPPHPDAPAWTVARLFELFPNLHERRHHLGKQLSGGEQQMLTIARTLMGNPRLLLLDEPSEGIAPVIVEQMAMIIGTIKREGLSILLSEQNMRFARAVLDRVYIIEKGCIRYSSTLAEFDADAEISRRYLAV